MDKTKRINEIFGVKESYQAPDALMSILYDKERRERVFREMLELFDYDVTYDWFHEYFQDEHADRKKKKQDFTPTSLGRLLSALIGEDDGMYYEPCAGTGGILIQRWDYDRKKHLPWDYKPSMYVYTVEELSERAFPFLLFNVMIRGMNAIVIQCDTISRKSRGAFFIQNDNDDHLQFSNLYRLPYSEAVANYLAVEWHGEPFEEADKPGKLPKHIFGDLTIDDIKKALGIEGEAIN